MPKLKSCVLEQPCHIHFVEQKEWVWRLDQLGPESILLAHVLAWAPRAITELCLPGEEKAQHVGSFLFPNSSQS